MTIVLAGSLAAQWIPQQSGTNAEFRGLSVVNANVVWASGSRGRVAHTTDGGTTWTVDSVAGATRLDFRAIHARDAKVAWVVSAGPADSGLAQIYMTQNAGSTWTRVFTTERKGVFFDAMGFWDASHGIVMSDPVDGKFVLLQGADWGFMSQDGLPPVLPGEAAFAASGTCLVVQGSSNAWIGTGGGARARVFRSTDRGKTWSVADTPIHAGTGASGIFSVAFVDALHGVVVGGDYTKAKEPLDNVALSDDGGRTWRLARGPLPPGYMSAVTYVPGTRGRTLIALGLAGTAKSSDGGESWTMIDSVAYNSVAFATPDAGWAVGPRGRIAKWSGIGSKP